MSKNALAHLICFLFGHNLQHYRLVYRNPTRPPLKPVPAPPAPPTARTSLSK